jgi:hypothetical protein
MSREIGKAINYRARRRTILLAGLIMAVAGAWLAYVTTAAHENGPKTVAFIGGGPDAVATFDGTTIQANTAIYADDAQGVAHAREYCGMNVAGRATLPWNVLQLSIGGGPANVCLRQGQSQTFGDVTVRVEQVGQVQAKRYDGRAIALSRVELSVSTTLAERIADIGAPLMLGFGMALCGAALSDGTRRGPEAPGRQGAPVIGEDVADGDTNRHIRDQISYVVSVGIALLVTGAAAVSLVLVGCSGASTHARTRAGPSSTRTSASARPAPPSPPSGPAQVQITVPGRPTPPATVPQAVLVQGTARNLRAGQKIWVFTQNPGSSHLNPQPQAAVISPAGSWTSQTFIGSSGDAGKQFQILAVTANPAAVNTITSYLARAHQSGNYPGLPSIPAGARLHDQVPVIRQGGPAPPSPPSGPAQVQITVPGRPTPPATVPQAVLVQGTARNLRAGQKIWVFTQNPGSSHLNPQPQAAVISPAGSWTSQTFIGSSGDAGKQFQILAVTANPAAVNTITSYLARAHQSGNYPGLPSIPAGARLHDQVPVIRT